MLLHLLKTAFRHLFRNRTFSFVNILGLAIGMTACWFLFEYVRFEWSFDRWHKNAARIYRVPLDFAPHFSASEAQAGSYGGVGPALKAEFPEVQEYGRIGSPSQFPGMNTLMLSYTDERGATRRFNETGIYLADASFLQMFSFPFVQGDRDSALAKPMTAVVSVSLARKYFGNADPMGKVMHFNGALLTVTGVFQDIAENSHIHFDMLVSMPPQFAHDWESGFYNYVLLAPGADPRKVEAKLPAFVEKYLGKKMRSQNLTASFHLQPLTDIHLRPVAADEPQPQGSEMTLYFLSILGVFLLVIAWINYVNLSTAKSLERAREVGVRKVAGASRWQLGRQFLLESMLINTMALGLTVLLVFLFGGLFDRFTGKGANSAFLHSGLLLEWPFWLILAGIFIGGALQVGAYPAFVLSAFRPVLVLKGRFQRSVKGIFLRRTLVTFQFLLSILLIAGTLVVYHQLQYMRSQDPGYARDQMLVVKAPARVDSTYTTVVNVFKTELLKDPAIRGVCATSDVPGQPVAASNGVRREDQDKANLSPDFLAIDKDFVSTYGIRLVAGTNIPADEPRNWPKTKQTRVMINQTLAAHLGYRSPAAAVHQTIYFMSWFGDIRAEIVGVVQDYQQQSLAVAYQPAMYYFVPQLPSYYSIHLDTRNLQRDLPYIKKAYEQAFPGNAYESFFLNAHFDRQYQADQKLGNFFGLFTGLAIFVACIGLLGLSSYMIRLRVREIGIRKVLGAPVYSLFVLLSRDFVRLVLLASAIAVPIVYFGAGRWLRNFAFHIRVSWLMLATPPLLLLGIALVTISVQSLRAASANPVEALRSE